MTPDTHTRYARTARRGFLPGQRSTAAGRMPAAPRRTSAVLSPQELRRIVCEMVD